MVEPDPAVSEQVRRWCEDSVRTGEAVRARSRYFLGDGRDAWSTWRCTRSGTRTASSRTSSPRAATSPRSRSRSGERQEHQERELTLLRAAERLAADRLDQLSAIALALVSAETVRDLERVVLDDCLKVLGADGGVLAARDDEVDLVRLAISDRPGADTPVGYAELPLTSPLPRAVRGQDGRDAPVPDPGRGPRLVPGHPGPVRRDRTGGVGDAPVAGG